MSSQDKLIKNSIQYTDALFLEILNRLKRGIQQSDTLESFLIYTKDYTMNNPLIVTGYQEKMIKIILQETNNHRFSRPSQKELTRVVIENQVGDLITNVGDDLKNNIREIVKHGYNNKLSQKEIADNITKKVNTIKNTRARTIARTEIARTATISDYIINKERGATHFTVDCRETCCDVCRNDYNFGKVEYDIKEDVIMLPPRHPNCRCVAMFFKKEGNDNQDNLEFNKYPSSSPEGTLKNIFAPLQDEEDYSESKERFGLISKNRFKKDIKGFIDSVDEDIIANLVATFRKDVPNVHVEFGATFLYGSIIGFSSFSNFTEIPIWIQEIGGNEELLVLIHNHGYDLSNFPSYDDLESYALYGVKYGITTNNFGTIIVKNTEQQLNKENAGNIRDDIIGIKKAMITDFENKFNKIYDKDNLEHNKEISQMVDENRDKYLKQYQDVLKKYGMEITFINE